MVNMYNFSSKVPRRPTQWIRMSDPEATERNALLFVAYLCRYDAVRHNSGFRLFGPSGVASEKVRITWAKKCYEEKAKIIEYVEDVLDDQEKTALEDAVESLKIKRAKGTGPGGRSPAENMESLSRYWVKAVGPAPKSLGFESLSEAESEDPTDRPPKRQRSFAKEAIGHMSTSEASSSDLSDFE